jgi:hypothetical protein
VYVRQCERQFAAVCTRAQCARQCAAVRLVVYGTVRLSGSAAVCGNSRQCAAVRAAVCGSASGSVW